MVLHLGAYDRSVDPTSSFVIRLLEAVIFHVMEF